MRVRQYVYFALHRKTVSAEEITAALGMTPDASAVKGSKGPVPVEHSWQVECREPQLFAEEQIAFVLKKLAPVQGCLVELIGDEVKAALVVVRNFEDDGDAELTLAEVEKQNQAGRQPLGLVLESEVVAFLAATGAIVSIDEYGF